MDLKNLQPTYTMRDMAKVLGRVAELTRENASLKRQLENTTKELEQAQRDNVDLTAQLYDLQNDLVRDMTAARVLSKERAYQA
jgi:cell division protein FtsB